MEYDDDEQFEDLFLTEKIEHLIREKVQVDVPAENYTEFNEKLNTDVFNLAKENGIESINSISFVPGEGVDIAPAQNKTESEEGGEAENSQEEAEEEAVDAEEDEE